MNLLNYFNTFNGMPTFGAAVGSRCRRLPRREQRRPSSTASGPRPSRPSSPSTPTSSASTRSRTTATGRQRHRRPRRPAQRATAPGTYAFIDVDAAAGAAQCARDGRDQGRPDLPAGGRSRRSGRPAALNTVAFVNGGDSASRAAGRRWPRPSRPSTARASSSTSTTSRARAAPATRPMPATARATATSSGRTPPTPCVDWLAADPTGTGDDDVLIVGDLNSYATEDPVAVLEDAGYTNLVAAFVDGPVLLRLRRPVGLPRLRARLGRVRSTQVAGVGEWHINADEPAVLDYNTDFKSAGQVLSLYAPDQFRVSDHDPILVGLDPVNDPPSVDAGGPYTVVEHGSVIVSADRRSDPEGTPCRSPGISTGSRGSRRAASRCRSRPATLEAPLTRTIRVRVTDAFGREAIDETTVRVIWSFAFRQPVQAPPTVNLWIAGLPVLVPFSLSGNQGLGVLDGAPTFTRDDVRHPSADGSVDRHLDDRRRAVLRTADRQLLVHLADGTIARADVRDADHRPRRRDQARRLVPVRLGTWRIDRADRRTLCVRRFGRVRDPGGDPRRRAGFAVDRVVERGGISRSVRTGVIEQRDHRQEGPRRRRCRSPRGRRGRWR